MAPKTHAVICFKKEDSVAVIPCSWIYETDDGSINCKFPPKGYKSTKKAVKKATEPAENWEAYEIRVFKKYESYELANANLAQSTAVSDWSDLETPRPKKAKVHLELPQPPVQIVQQFQDPFRSVDLLNETILPDADPVPTSSTTHSPHQQQSGPMNQLENLVTTAFVVDDTDFKAAALKKLEEIRLLLQEQQSTLAAVLERLGNPLVQTTSSFMSPVMLPLKAMTDLQPLEEMIWVDQDAYNKLGEIFSTVGGNTVEEAVGLMLSKLMTDDVLACFSLKGKWKLGKPGVLKLERIVELMLRGLLGNPRTSVGANVKALHDAISKGLKRADDRVRSRNNLKQKREDVANTNFQPNQLYEPAD